MLKNDLSHCDLMLSQAEKPPRRWDSQLGGRSFRRQFEEDGTKVVAPPTAEIRGNCVKRSLLPLSQSDWGGSLHARLRDNRRVFRFTVTKPSRVGFAKPAGRKSCPASHHPRPTHTSHITHTHTHRAGHSVDFWKSDQLFARYHMKESGRVYRRFAWQSVEPVALIVCGSKSSLDATFWPKAKAIHAKQQTSIEHLCEPFVRALLIWKGLTLINSTSTPLPPSPDWIFKW